MTESARAKDSAARRLGIAVTTILVAALLPLVVPVSATAASVTETEPNSSRSTANVVPIGTPVSGSSLLSGSYDYDNYAVDLPSAGRVSLGLTFPSNLGAGDVYEVDVYDSSGTQLYYFEVTGNRHDGSWLRSFSTFAPEGRLYLRIYGSSSWASWGTTYSLNVGFTAGHVETEFNSSRTTADVIPIGTPVSGSSLLSGSYDYDNYAVDLPSAGRVSLGLTFPSNLGAGDVYEVDVYDSSGTQLYYFEVTGNRHDGSWLRSFSTFAPEGRLYVRIYGSSSWASWGKTYSLNVGFTAGQVETELNSSRTTADVIPIGTPVSGSSLLSGSYDYDYYAVDLTSARSLSLALTFPSDLGAGDVYEVDVYNPSGSNLYHFDVIGSQYAGGSLAGQYVSLPAGRSYVRVYGSSSWASWGEKYSLTARYVFSKTPAPTVSGTAKVGSTLTAKPGAWSPSATTITYQWLRNGKAISGATKSTYKLIAADAGKSVTVKTTASRSSYRTVATVSAAKKIALQVLTKTPTPTITGTAKVGSTLTAKPGTWAPATVSLKYQWLRNGKSISGATKSTYKLASADKGKKISVKVTGSKSTYKTASTTSAAKTVS